MDVLNTLLILFNIHYRRTISRILSIIITFLAADTAAFASVGFQTLTAFDLKVGIWFPTDHEEVAGQLGPFDVRLAFDAPPLSQGTFQPVLISHGNGGRMRNHHLTAKTLAESGFIVIAPLHRVDHLIDTDKRFAALNYRTNELAQALESVLQLDEFRRIIDLSKIHAIGYSLGAISVLHAAGMGYDNGLVLSHCMENPDPEFCKRSSFIDRQKMRYFRDVVPPNLSRDIPGRYFSLPIITGGVAVIAPIGQGLLFADNLFSATQVFIVGLKDDDIALPQYHARYLSKVISDKYIYRSEIREGTHWSFIAPFAKRVTDVEFIEPAQDRDGFDRDAFQHVINTDLTKFFILQSGR